MLSFANLGFSDDLIGRQRKMRAVLLKRTQRHDNIERTARQGGLNLHCAQISQFGRRRPEARRTRGSSAHC